MELVVQRAAGLDVHKRSVTACVRVPDEHGWNTEVRTFRTFTPTLEALASWLEGHGVTHVAMEATGIYWRPVWQVLEGRFALTLANPRHVKALPGRKTDVGDAQWLAELCAHGLVAPSFVPDARTRQLRDLTRYRSRQVQLRTQETQRMAKVLEDAGIKLDSVASKTLTVSGRAMIEALCGGERDPDVLAELARGRLRARRDDLRLALAGRFGDHHRALLTQMLRRADDLEGAIAELDHRIATLVEPDETALELLCTIPGVARTTAEIIVAETGADMGRFPTPAHLASWAGMCPGNDESAGRRRSGRTRPGNAWLRAALRQAATAAARTKDTYLASQYWQLARRRGQSRAVIAVGHTILVIAWHVLAHQVAYRELGADWFAQRRDPALRTRRLVAQLEALGHRVELMPTAI
jgi:transposase